MAINQSVMDEINQAIRKLNVVSSNVVKEVQEDLKQASTLVLSAIKGRVPVSDRAHSRYSTPKVVGSLRAPKGSGRIVATYQPGNLQKSFRTLTFRRSKAVFVGPKLGGVNDGYYAHWPEFGTVTEFGTVKQPAQGYVKAAVDASGKIAADYAAKLLKRRVERYAEKFKI